MDISNILSLISLLIGIFALLYTITNKINEKFSTINEEESRGEQPEEINDPNNFSWPQFVGILMIFICSILWGVSHVLAKSLINDSIDPVIIVIWRQLVAALLVAIVATIIYPFSEKNHQNINFSFNDRDALAMILGRGLAAIFYIMSLAYISATSVSILYKLNTIFVFIIVIYTLKNIKSVSIGITIAGIVCAFIGTITITVETGGIYLTNHAILGYVFAILAPLAWAIYLVASEKHEGTRYNTTDLYQRSLYLSKILILSSLIPLIYIILSYLIPILSYNPNIQFEFLASSRAIFQMTGLGILSGIIAILYFEAVKKISSILVSVLIFFEIIITYLLESLLLAYKIDIHIFFSAILIIIGSYLISTQNKFLNLSRNI